MAITILIITGEFWREVCNKEWYAYGVSEEQGETTIGFRFDEKFVTYCENIPLPLPSPKISEESWADIRYGELDEEHNCIVKGELAFQLAYDSRTGWISNIPLPLP